MFAALPSRRQRRSFWISFALHCVVAYLLFRPLEPIFVRPIAIAHGRYGDAIELVYPASQRARAEESASPELVPKRLTWSREPQPVLKRREQRTNRQAERSTVRETQTQADLAGTPFGSLSSGPTSGFEVRPALPYVFPDIPRYGVPSEVQGNVVVEVTISAQGEVVDARVLESVGYGIEELALATVRQWRFRPATRDGEPVPSRQDIYFHFPR
jgi:TonB family protein